MASASEGESGRMKTATKEKIKRTARTAYRDVKKVGKVGLKMAGEGALAGLGTYGAVKLGTKVLKPVARLKQVRRAVPELAKGIQRNFDTPSAHDWGATAGIFAAGDVLTNALTHGTHRLHRYFGGKRFKKHEKAQAAHHKLRVP